MTLGHIFVWGIRIRQYRYVIGKHFPHIYKVLSFYSIRRYADIRDSWLSIRLGIYDKVHGHGYSAIPLG